MKKFTTLLFFLSSVPVLAPHYHNKSEHLLIITNETVKKDIVDLDSVADIELIETLADCQLCDLQEKGIAVQLCPGDEIDFDNNQGDEISITCPHLPDDMRKLFPTNNYFNYVITYNAYSPKFEKFNINHADPQI